MVKIRIDELNTESSFIASESKERFRSGILFHYLITLEKKLTNDGSSLIDVFDGRKI